MLHDRSEYDARLRGLLTDAQAIAIVGCSPRTTRASNRIARYLVSTGYNVLPVNPHHTKVLGLTCYPALDKIPIGTVVDIVDIFRHPRHTAGIVAEAFARGNLQSRMPTVWTQLGVSSPEAEQQAAIHGIEYVHNRCIMVEHSRLLDSAVK